MVSIMVYVACRLCSFWLLKLTILRGGTVDEQAELYRVKRRVHQNSLWYYPMLFLDPFVWYTPHPSVVGAYWAFGLTLLAVAKQINYNHVQFMVMVYN